MAQRKNPSMKIIIEGPEVGPGKVDVDVFLNIIQGTVQAIKRVAVNISQINHQSSRGRYPRVIEDQCQILFTGWDKGSGIAELQARPLPQENLFNIVDEAMTTLIKGTNELRSSGGIFPKGIDTNVVNLTSRVLSPLKGKGISRIIWQKSNGAKGVRAELDKEIYAQIEKLRVKSQESNLVLEGKIYQINLKNRTAKLETRKGEAVLCRFDDAMQLSMIKGLTHFIRIRGTGTRNLSTNQVSEIFISIIEQIPSISKPRVATKISQNSLVQDPILSLSGLGKEIWEGVDADQYVKELREGWD